MVELKLCLENLERERDFYFGKLRDIEVRAAPIMSCPDEETNISLVSVLPCQAPDRYVQVIITSSGQEKEELSQKVLDVLYATEVVPSPCSSLHAPCCRTALQYLTSRKYQRSFNSGAHSVGPYLYIYTPAYATETNKARTCQ